MKRCLRFYPQDDNQGGFFVAVFEKHADVGSGRIEDKSGVMDAWSDKRVRQKDMLSEVDDFAKWFEEEQKKAYDKDNVPVSEREDLGLSASMAEAKASQQKRIEASGIKLTNLSAAMAQKAEEEESKKFAYANLRQENEEAWLHIQEFFGIDDDFPCEYLYF